MILRLELSNDTTLIPLWTSTWSDVSTHSLSECTISYTIWHRDSLYKNLSQKWHPNWSDTLCHHFCATFAWFLSESFIVQFLLAAICGEQQPGSRGWGGAQGYGQVLEELIVWATTELRHEEPIRENETLKVTTKTSMISCADSIFQGMQYCYTM